MNIDIDAELAKVSRTGYTVRRHGSPSEETHHIDWESGEIPLPNTEEARFLLITPTMAARWLKERNTNNRGVTEERVAAYLEEIQAGGWRVNNQAIGFGRDGTLYDGQHRLLAILRSGKSVKSLVVFGMTPESRETIDIVKPRRVDETLAMVRGLQNSRKLVSMVKAIEVIVTNEHPILTPESTMTRIKTYEKGLMWAVKALPGAKKFDQAPVAGALAFAYPTAPEKIDKFAHQLRTGEGLSAGDPALTLRSYVLERRQRADSRRIVSLKTLRAAKAAVEDERMFRLFETEDVIDFFEEVYTKP